MGAVHLPEDVTMPATEGTENTEQTANMAEAAGARAAMEALCTRRRQLEARMIRPARGHGRPR